MNLYSLNPDWQLAINHGKATKTGRNHQSVQHIQQNRICQCCLNLIEKQQISLTQNSKQLQFLGFGFPLYFIFMKYSIILVILQALSYSALSILFALQSSNYICRDNGTIHLPNGHEGICTSWLILFMRSDTVVDNKQIVLRISSFFIHMIGLLYIRDVINKTNSYYHQRYTLLSHFSLLISNLPKEPRVKQKIQYFFAQQLGADLHIKDVIFIHQMDEYKRLYKQKLNIIQQKKKQMNKQIPQFGEIDQKLENIEELLKRQFVQQLKRTEGDNIVCEKAIIILNKQQQKIKALYFFQNLSKQSIKRCFAPEPKQINWQNLTYPTHKKNIKRIAGWAFTFIFIFASAAIFFGILYRKNQTIKQAFQQLKLSQNIQHQKQLEQITLALSISIMLLIIFYNKYILAFALHHFTHLQKHYTGSDYQFSLGFKYTFGVFFMTAVMGLIIEDFIFQNIYSENQGLVQQQTIQLFFNALLVPLVWFINVQALYRSLKQWWNKGRKDMTQWQANKLMQNIRFSLGKYYAEIIQSIWFVYMYSSLIPLGAPVMVFGLGISYWVSKYNLLRKTSISENVNEQMSKKMLKLLDFSLLLRGVGDLIFDIQIRDGKIWQPLLFILIGILYLIIPLDKLIQNLHSEVFKSEDKTYQQTKNDFKIDYRTLHCLFIEEKMSQFKKTNIHLQSSTEAIMITSRY